MGKTTLNSKPQSTFLYPMILAVLTLSACGRDLRRQAEVSTSNPSIVNGAPVDESDPVSRATAGVYMNLPDSDIAVLFCSATLIGERTLVTAAHCLRSAEGSVGMSLEEVLPYLRIGFGLKNVEMLTAGDIKLVPVADARVHESFRLDALESIGSGDALADVALVRVSEQPPAHYRPVSLLRDASVLTNGLKLTIAGFGLTRGNPFAAESEGLRKAEIEITDNTHNPVQFMYSYVNETGSCSGDSGGPAFVNGENGELTLAGVTSYGDSGCMAYGVWTSVPALSEWIDQNIAVMERAANKIAPELLNPGMLEAPLVSQFTSRSPVR